MPRSRCQALAQPTRATAALFSLTGIALQMRRMAFDSLTVHALPRQPRRSCGGEGLAHQRPYRGECGLLIRLLDGLWLLIEGGAHEKPQRHPWSHRQMRASRRGNHLAHGVGAQRWNLHPQVRLLSERQ